MFVILGILSVITTSVYSVRLIVMIVSRNYNVGGKLLRIEKFDKIMSYVRLGLGSVVFREFIYFLNSPNREFLVVRIIKDMPLLLMVLGILIGVLISGNSRLVFGYWGSYLLFFNPIFHKL